MLPILLCLFVVHFLCAPIYGSNEEEGWTQYRGPNRDGISISKTSIKAWPSGGEPFEVWRRPIGEGFSGISIVGEQLVTAFAEDGKELLGGFDGNTGKEMWRTALGPKFEEEMGNGPRATPTIDGEFAYMLDSTGGLFCVNVKSGDVIWQVSLTDDFKIKRPRRGFSCSPLIAGKMLILHGGGEDAAFIGLDKTTGKTLWKTGDAAAGHSSPFMATINGTEQAVFTIARVVDKDGERKVIDEAVAVLPSGEVLWRGPSLPQIIAMPVFVPPNKVFISSSVENGCLLIQVKPDGKVETVWHNKEMRNHFNSSVYYEGHIYGFSSSTLKCLVADTAERKWSKRGYGKGSLIVADNKLIVLSDRGKLALIEANPKGFNELAQAKVLNEKSWTCPSFAEGKIYLRTHKEMVCYDLSK
jgi:outer membrane protein assembly factor BamB